MDWLLVLKYWIWTVLVLEFISVTVSFFGLALGLPPTKQCDIGPGLRALRVVAGTATIFILWNIKATIFQ